MQVGYKNFAICYQTTTSPHCSGTFTGCVSRSASSSGYVCWSTGVCTARHRRTSPTTSSWLLLLVPAVNSGLLTLRLWWSGLPDARRSATAHFLWQLHAPGTASRQLPGTRRHFFPSGAAWRHGCLNWHWRDSDLILWMHFISFLPMRFLVTLQCYSWQCHSNLYIFNNDNNNNNKSLYLADDTRQCHSCYGRRIGTRMRSIKWCHLKWPWVTLNLDFKVTG